MDAKRYGHLDRVSAFPFENMLKNIKNMLRKPGAKLVQVINRCFENEYHFKKGMKVNKSIDLKEEHDNGPLISSGDKQQFSQYKKLFFSNYRLSIFPPNNVIIIQNGNETVILIIENILKRKTTGEVLVFGKRYLKIKKSVSFSIIW